MADRPINAYLNDHLAGATAGTDLAAHIAEHYAGTPFGDEMRSIAEEIDTDRQTLIDLMERLGTITSPIKQAIGWIAEKAGGIKFTGVLSGSPEQGAFMAIESLILGVEGKACMWTALKDVASEYPSLATTNLDDLIARAEQQKAILQRQRRSMAATLFQPSNDAERSNPYSRENPPSRDERVWATNR
jgi:hypothetical protein